MFASKTKKLKIREIPLRSESSERMQFSEFDGLGLLDRKRCCIVEDIGLYGMPPMGGAEIRAYFRRRFLGSFNSRPCDGRKRHAPKSS